MRFLYLILAIIIAAILIFNIKDHFEENKGSKLSSWATKQIENDLSVFNKKKFTKSDINSVFADLANLDDNLLLRFQIIDKVLYANYQDINPSSPELINAYNIFYKFFKHMINLYDFDKNVEFIISINSHLSTPDDYVFKAPIIVPVKNPQNRISQYTPIAPDNYTLSEWPRLYDDILVANDKYSWDRKIAKAFWRGSVSGGVFTRENWESFPRVKLVQLSVEHPNLIDAKFTNFASDEKNIEEAIAEKYPMALILSQADQVKYKIQIAAEGNTRSLSGELWRLLSNSVVLKQKSEKVQWFYPILKEDVDYFNIESDMSDLVSKVEWFLSHDKEAKKTAFESSELIKKEITPEHLYLYWSHLLKEYSKHQDFELSKPTLMKAKRIE